MTLFVEGLEVAARIGVHDHEKGRTQPLVFDVEIGTAPVREDAIGATIDYAIVANAIDRVLGAGHIDLVETVAQRVASHLLAIDAIADVSIRVRKPGAIPGAAAAGCSWTAGRR